MFLELKSLMDNMNITKENCINYNTCILGKDYALAFDCKECTFYKEFSIEDAIAELNNNYAAYISFFEKMCVVFKTLTAMLKDLKAKEDIEFTISGVLIVDLQETFQTLLNVDKLLDSEDLLLDESDKENLAESMKDCFDSLIGLADIDYAHGGALGFILFKIYMHESISMGMYGFNEYMLTIDKGTGEIKAIAIKCDG